MTLTRQLAEFVTSADAARLPRLDRDILRRHACDAALARLLGGRSEEGRQLRRVFGPGLGPDGIAGIAGLIRMTEMDDIHTGANTTPSSVSAPVAFCLYPDVAADPRALESAIWVGTELMVRFGKAMDGAKALFLGFWPTRSAATLAACAIACRLMGLSLADTEEALSLALMTTAGRSGRFVREPSGRWIVFANAVSTGLRMAFAAREGFRGAENRPDGAWVAAALGLAFDAEQLTTNLATGSVFPELSLKPYATARQGLGVTEAVRSLVAEGLDPETITRVVARVPTSHRAMVAQPLLPDARASAFVSAACQIATAALVPASLYDVDRREVLDNPRIRDFASRVEIVGDPALDREFPRVWSAEVEVEAGGRVVTRRVAEPPGSATNRLDDAGLLEKATRALRWVGEEARATELLDLGGRMFVDARAASAMADVFREA